MKTAKTIASECFAGLYPQNTMSGFKHCVDTNVTGIEFDVHLSADGHVVVQHDYFLNKRTTRDRTGNWLEKSGEPLCKRRLSNLKTYDVGRYLADSAEANSHPDYQPIDGERIPTLEEFLAYHKEQSSTAELWIELKTSPFQRSVSSAPKALTDAALQAIDKFDCAEQCVLLAFEWDLLIAAQSVNSQIQTNFLTINPVLTRQLNHRRGAIDTDLLYGSAQNVDEDQLWLAIADANGHWWGPYVHDVNAADVSAAQDVGVKVNLWGVDSSQLAIQNALELGADAITLGRPDMVAPNI